MEPSVQKFLTDYKHRVAECDGPPHRFGEARPGPDGKCAPFKKKEEPPPAPPTPSTPTAAAAAGGAQ
jgi:hypothetical protein